MPLLFAGALGGSLGNINGAPGGGGGGETDPDFASVVFLIDATKRPDTGTDPDFADVVFLIDNTKE